MKVSKEQKVFNKFMKLVSMATKQMEEIQELLEDMVALKDQAIDEKKAIKKKKS